MFHRSGLLAALALVSALSFTATADAQGKRLARTDADGDGKISLQEFLTARGRIFERMDANHDGQVTKDEVAAFQAQAENVAAGAMIRSGKARGGEGGRQLARFAEMTANGPVTRAQWDALTTKRFQRLDTAGTGFITIDQMRPGRGAPPTDADMAPPKS